MKRMLINATQEEELRMAMVDGQRLYDLNIEAPASERKKANIYKGKITRIEPSLEAAFVNYGAERHGFLPLKEISPEYFVKDADSGKPNIRDVLKEGQDIVVQIDKEERGNKGAALTTFVSLAGRFIVLKPNKSRSGGVSRRITGDDRDAARKSLKNVEVPDGMSVILRTAGIDRSTEELAWDLENLLNVWQAILKVVVERPSPFLIYRESNAVVRALRDYLTNEIGEILIDDEATYNEARDFVEQVMPHNQRKLKHYTDPVPLFTRYQIESQIESAFAHLVHLPSGGSLVIDHTEALVSIDINSARATKGGDIEATALNTNLEAADEVARQLRLRDLGGLVVIDFIDMGPQKNQRDVENRLREAVRQDRARVQIGKISRFGLLEMSRQRLRPSLGESAYLTCPRCSGIGNIRSVESLALAILRLIGEEARKERTAKVIAQLPVEVATYLLNEKRDWVQNLESRNDTQVVMVANELLETPHYRIRRVRDDQVELPENTGSSYTLSEPDEDDDIPESLQERKPAEVAAVTTVVATTPAPPRPVIVSEEPKGPGFLARLAAMFAGSSDDKKEKPKKKTKKKAGSAKRGKKASDSRGGQRGRRRGGQDKDGDKGRSDRSRGGSKKRSKKSADKPDSKKAAEQKDNRDKKQDQQAKHDGESNGEQPRKKRRSRGGRRRRKSNGERSEQQNSQQSSQQGKGSDQSAGPDTAKDKPQQDSSAKAEATKSSKPASKRSDGDSKPVQTATDDKQAAKDAQATKAPAEAKLQSEKPAAKPKKAATGNAGEKPGGESGKSSYDDTQPELPQIKTTDTPPAKSAARSRKPASGSDSAAVEQKPAAKPKAAEKPAAPTEPAAPKDASKETRTEKAPAKKPEPEKKSTKEAEKPAGRLLPWEPQPKADSKPSGDDKTAS